MCKSRLKVYFFLFVGLTLSVGVCRCGSSSNDIVTDDDPAVDDALIKEDSSTGIDVVGLSISHPMEVRKRIFESEIPAVSFEEKRQILYAVLDTLYKLKAYQEEDIYAEVDSLNYLAIHYLKNILLDKKSRLYPLKHKMLNQITSSDKTFSIYYWEENIGEPIPTTLSVYQYFGTDGNLHSFFNMDDQDREDFDFSTSKIIGIYKLSSTHEQMLYLLNFEGCTGNESCFKGSTIAEITENGLKFDYNSFGEGVEYFFESYASGDKLTISYNAKLKELTYKHVFANKSEQKVFLFDGAMFGAKE